MMSKPSKTSDPAAPSLTSDILEGRGIAFIDVEASGLGAYSWPIEVGWGFHGYEPHAVFVRPADHWSMSAWEKGAESLHKITPDKLLTHGRPPLEVALGLNGALGMASAVYSDAPDYDSFWLFRLYQAAGVKPNFVISDVTDLLQPLWREEPKVLAGRAAASAPHLHRAQADVRHMQTMYEIALRNGHDGAGG